MQKRNGKSKQLATIEGQSFTDQIRRVMAASVTDDRLTAIINKQLELAEDGDRKAAEFVIKMCGGQSPSTLVQNNYYYGEGSEEREGLKAKTPLGNRVKQYLLKHGPCKPAVLAVELDAEPEEVLQELTNRPDRFQPDRDGWVAV